MRAMQDDYVFPQYKPPSYSGSGNCEDASDIASDGSRCGDRAASER